MADITRCDFCQANAAYGTLKSVVFLAANDTRMRDFHYDMCDECMPKIRTAIARCTARDV